MDDIVIRECTAIDELDDCVRLQREVFGLPELEISPRRHLIVSREAGGGPSALLPARVVVLFITCGRSWRHEILALAYDGCRAGNQNQGVGAR